MHKYAQCTNKTAVNRSYIIQPLMFQRHHFVVFPYIKNKQIYSSENRRLLECGCYVMRCAIALLLDVFITPTGDSICFQGIRVSFNWFIPRFLKTLIYLNVFLYMHSMYFCICRNLSNINVKAFSASKPSFHAIHINLKHADIFECVKQVIFGSWLRFLWMQYSYNPIIFIDVLHKRHLVYDLTPGHKTCNNNLYKTIFNKNKSSTSIREQQVYFERGDLVESRKSYRKQVPEDTAAIPEFRTNPGKLNVRTCCVYRIINCTNSIMHASSLRKRNKK